MKYCENCGTLLEENAKFCQRCGMPTTEAQSAPQPDAPEVKTATPGMTNEPAGEAPKSLDELKQDLKKSLKEGRQAEATDFKKNPFGIFSAASWSWSSSPLFLYSVPELLKSRSWKPPKASRWITVM